MPVNVAALSLLVMISLGNTSFASHSINTDGLRVLQSEELQAKPMQVRDVKTLNTEELSLYSACGDFYPYQVRTVVKTSLKRQQDRLANDRPALAMTAEELKHRGGCEDLIQVFVAEGYGEDAILQVIYSR